jgi:hypothetical protein
MLTYLSLSTWWEESFCDAEYVLRENTLVKWIGLTQKTVQRWIFVMMVWKFGFLNKIYILFKWITANCSCKSMCLFCNYRLLNHIAEINSSSESDELWRFLGAVYHSSVPDPGRTLQVPFNNGRGVCTLFLYSLYVKYKLGSSLIIGDVCISWKLSCILNNFVSVMFNECCKENIILATRACC